MTPARAGATPEVTLVFDGGSRGNPGPAYGSYVVRWPGQPAATPRRLRFGPGTNNEAEYRALLAGLEGVLHELPARGLEPGRTRLIVRGDSQLVLRQLEGVWKARQARLRVLRDQALGLLASFGEVRFSHQPRSLSVRLLGH